MKENEDWCKGASATREG